MAKHKHVIYPSEVPLDKINAPEGSAFGGPAAGSERTSVRKNWDTVFSTCRRAKPRSLSTPILAMRK